MNAADSEELKRDVGFERKSELTLGLGRSGFGYIPIRPDPEL